MRNKVILKVYLKNNSEMDFSLYGIRQSEVDTLMQEFDPQDYYNYDGQFMEYYVFKGVEVLMYLLEKYKAKKLLKYEPLFFSPRQEISLYELSDGRIVTVTVISAAFYKNRNEFLSFNNENKLNKLFKKKRIPKTDYPILRVEYLPDGRKIFYHEISPVEGELLSKYYKKDDNNIYPYKDTRSVFEVAGNQILEYWSIGEKYFLYEKNNFIWLQDRRKLILEHGRELRSGLIAKREIVNQRMCGRNPYGKQFVDKSNEIEAQLFLHKRLPRDLISRDLGGIIHLEKYVYQNLVTATLSDELFLPVLAFSGNLLVESKKGYAWKMQFDEIYQTWVPDIYNGEFLRLYEPILDLLDPESIKGSYHKFSNFMRMKL